MAQDQYIHGFGPAEERRLREQAEVLAPVVLDDLPLPEQGRLLELGCGVGAELALLARLRPRLSLTGIDLSETHLGAARRGLGERAKLVRGDAARLPFAAGRFETVMTIWLLEHVPDPAAVLGEALRVLTPEGLLICTEVDNASFSFDPEPATIRLWWDLLCERQRQAGGDPEIGRRLAELARSLGCREIQVRDLPVVSSRLDPARRPRLVDYLEDLLISAAGRLQTSAGVDRGLIEALRGDFARVRADPGIRFEYHAVRLTCQAPIQLESR